MFCDSSVIGGGCENDNRRRIFAFSRVLLRGRDRYNRGLWVNTAVIVDVGDEFISAERLF